jgi:NADPH:quinone reductase-like Zn-dependent oxidoreductase
MRLYSTNVKAYEIPAFGFDKLVITERPAPEPSPKQVRVRMEAWSLNYRDQLVIEGRYNPKMKLPVIPLSDGVGTVTAVGSEVSSLRVGDKVASLFMQTWLDGPYFDAYGKSALGGAIDGVLAEEVLLDEAGAVPYPAELTPVEAATLPCAAVTAWDALIEQGQLKPAETVVVLGTGGVSIFALQFATALGARVIATTGSKEKEQKLRDLGAAEVINYRETADWEKKVRELTGGAGADHVVEVGGANTFTKSLLAARGGGNVYVIGNLSGLTTDINVGLILHKFLRVQGIYVGSRAMFEAMNQFITKHHLKPVVDRVFRFEEAPAALEYMKSGAHFGKVVLQAG